MRPEIAFPSRVDSDDRVIFYFAGHGVALESDDGPKGFILPQDAKRNSESNYLPMAELDEALSALPCRHMLLILDCCFAMHSAGRASGIWHSHLRTCIRSGLSGSLRTRPGRPLGGEGENQDVVNW
jgi:hypothetical protein